MDVIIHGALGRMGCCVKELIESGARPDMRVVCAVDPKAQPNQSDTARALDDYKGHADVLIDFSHHAATATLVSFAKAQKLPLVIATTGQTPEELALIKDAAKEIPIFLSANFSLGVALLTRLAREAVRILPNPEVEIVETHHDQKLDAPSGTALALATAISDILNDTVDDTELVYGRFGYGKRKAKEIGVHSLRLGTVVGEHDVKIASGNEILTLTHQAQSRTVFAEGALTAAAFIVGKSAGCYSMDDLVDARETR